MNKYNPNKLALEPMCIKPVKSKYFLIGGNNHIINYLNSLMVMTEFVEYNILSEPLKKKKKEKY